MFNDSIEKGRFYKLDSIRKSIIIPAIQITGETSGGDIVLISQSVSGYEIEPLIEETEDMKEKVTSLLEKLKNKK